MAETCYVCNGKGKFTAIVYDWTEPKPTPPYYSVTVKEEEMLCKCCDGRGGSCGC